MSKKNKNKKRQIIAMLLGLFSMGKIGFKQEAHFTSAISNSVKTDKNIFSLSLILYLPSTKFLASFSFPKGIISVALLTTIGFNLHLYSS